MHCYIWHMNMVAQLGAVHPKHSNCPLMKYSVTMLSVAPGEVF